MRRHILAIVAVLLLVPVAWFGYKALGPHPVKAIEAKVGLTRGDTSELRGDILDLVTVASGVVGIAGFFGEHRRSRKKARK
jgi:hypothetical protein